MLHLNSTDDTALLQNTLPQQQKLPYRHIGI
jgi:hypothetical protein